MVKKPRCKGCTERHAGCHAECESYLTFVREHREELEHIRKIKENENAIAETTYASKAREEKRRRWV